MHVNIQVSFQAFTTLHFLKKGEESKKLKERGTCRLCPSCPELPIDDLQCFFEDLAEPIACTSPGLVCEIGTVN